MFAPEPCSGSFGLLLLGVSNRGIGDIVLGILYPTIVSLLVRAFELVRFWHRRQAFLDNVSRSLSLHGHGHGSAGADGGGAGVVADGGWRPAPTYMSSCMESWLHHRVWSSSSSRR